MATITDIANAVAKLVELATKWNTILNGGVGVTVPTDSGPLPSVAKLIADLGEQIVTGHAAGYVVVVADNAARALAVPAQAYQLCIQADTKAIYYAPNTTMGSWVIHPLQAALASADAATAAVATLTSSLAGKMTEATYVGGAAAGIVRTATRIEELVAFAEANPTASLRLYGVENGVLGLYTPPQSVRARFLSGGALSADTGSGHQTLTNTVRNGLAIGANFALVGEPLRCLSWGSQEAAGILGSGMSAGQSFRPRIAVAAQQPDRNLPDFDPLTLATTDNQVERIMSLKNATVLQTKGGQILVAGTTGKGVRPLFGSGIDKTQKVFMPVYFNQSGTNKKIVQFDVCQALSGANSTGIFLDENEGIWLVTTNPTAAGYGNGLSGAQYTPVRLNAGFSSWTGKNAKKIRCDVTGGIYILFTNGELWAGGGSNATGLLGTGSTANVLNPIQIRTGVTDFEVSGMAGTTLALWTLEGTTLRAAGYNANGQMGQGATLTNRTSFVTVASNIELVRMGGTDNVTLIYKNTSGDWFGLGRNTDGAFGQGVAVTTNGTAVTLTNLKTILTANGGLATLTISGYAGKHSACVVCANGKSFTAGNNTDGCLANGLETDVLTWAEVLWTPRDATEKIIDVSACTSPASAPSFTWLTNLGRVLQAGQADFGFATGVTPTAVYNVPTAAGVQIEQAA